MVSTWREATVALHRRCFSYGSQESRRFELTLKTRCFSLSVSNSVYMVLSMETTCNGVMWLQMRVKPTTSLKRMVTSGNTWKDGERGGDTEEAAELHHPLYGKMEDESAPRSVFKSLISQETPS